MAGLAQKDIEAATGIPQTTYDTWERGQSKQPVEGLAKIQAAFPQIDIAWVISGTRYGETLDQVREEMLEWNRGLAGQMTLGRKGQKMVENLLAVLESKNAEAITMTDISLKAARMLADQVARRGIGKKKGRKN